MPERRARMLSVAEAPVVSVPVSVPVVSPDNWMREPAHELAQEPEPAQASAPAAPRFMSQDEDEDSGSAKAFYFSSAAPAVATTVTVAASPAKPEAGSGAEPAPGFIAAPPAAPLGKHAEPEPAPQPRDYAEDFPSRTWSASELQEQGAPPVTPLFSQNHNEAERDLDVPAFMRRLQF
jgi:hypothetical protein